MFEIIKYVNSRNEEIIFGENGIYANENELRDYSWNYSDDSFLDVYKTIRDRKLPIIIFANSETEGIEKRNRLHEVFDYDVITKQQGRFYIGDYYLECYITESNKKTYLQSKRELHIDCKVTSIRDWTRDITTLFTKGEITQEGLNFPFNYPFDFSREGMQNETLYNDHFTDSNFRMIINGYVESPEVVIGGNVYRVNTVVEENELLTIDSRSRKIYITKTDGSIVNHFKDRDTRNYVFEKVKAGNQNVVWGDFDFEITLYNERSEPLWT